MRIWIRYPLTDRGRRMYGKPHHLLAAPVNRLSGFMTMAPVVADVFDFASLRHGHIISYGHGLLMERSSIEERMGWYLLHRPDLTRKAKKKLIGTRSRRR